MCFLKQIWFIVSALLLSVSETNSSTTQRVQQITSKIITLSVIEPDNDSHTSNTSTPPYRRQYFDQQYPSYNQRQYPQQQYYPPLNQRQQQQYHPPLYQGQQRPSDGSQYHDQGQYNPNHNQGRISPRVNQGHFRQSSDQNRFYRDNSQGQPYGQGHFQPPSSQDPFNQGFEQRHVESPSNQGQYRSKPSSYYGQDQFHPQGHIQPLGPIDQGKGQNQNQGRTLSDQEIASLLQEGRELAEKYRNIGDEDPDTRVFQESHIEDYERIRQLRLKRKTIEPGGPILYFTYETRRPAGPGRQNEGGEVGDDDVFKTEAPETEPPTAGYAGGAPTLDVNGTLNTGKPGEQQGTTQNEAMEAASRFTTRRTTTRRRRRTTPFRISLEVDCDYLAYYCLRAYNTGFVCARTTFYIKLTFKNYCLLDYVNCMMRHDLWQIVHMGECFDLKILTVYKDYPDYRDMAFLERDFILEEV